MNIKITLAAAFAALALAAPLSAKPLNYALPDDTAALKKGPGLELAEGNCASCHSVDYINTQPRGPKFGGAFWQAEVTKMIKVYGAPIDDADAKKIVDYLTAAYGAPTN